MVRQAFFGRHKVIVYIRIVKMIYTQSGYLHTDAAKLVANEGYRLWENLMVYPNGEIRDLLG